MASTIDCKYVEESELATSYLAGRLSESEAEAFERHYLACDRCKSDLQMLSELRASLGRPAVVPLERAKRSASTWRLAVAAALAIAVVGLWQLRLRSVDNRLPAYRGASETLSIKAESLAGGRIRLSWPPDAQAQVYIVEILRSDGVSVWKRETADPGVTIESTALGAQANDASFAAKVQALDSLGQVIATSKLTSLPHP